MSVSPVNPGTLFGGTWVAWGVGRVPVGVDTAQTEFDTVDKTGGAKTHTLTVGQMPVHAHTQWGISGDQGAGAGRLSLQADGNLVWYRGNGTTWGAGAGAGGGRQQVTVGGGENRGTSNSGSGEAHNNLQPYITCYMWKRTA